MATHRKYFSELAIDAEFNMEVAGLTGAFRKVSAQKAINLSTPPVGTGAREAFKVYARPIPGKPRRSRTHG